LQLAFGIVVEPRQCGGGKIEERLVILTQRCGRKGLKRVGEFALGFAQECEFFVCRFALISKPGLDFGKLG